MQAWDPKVTPWSVDPSGYATRAPIERKIRFLLRYAVLAPSRRNSQPWLFHIRGSEVRVYADTSRWLRVADPDQRELYISLGCAIENLLVAAEYFGFGHDVAYAEGDSAEGAAAVVTLASGVAPTDVRGAEMFDAIRLRKTNHGVYADREIEERVLERLRRAVVEPGLEVYLSGDPALKAAVNDLVARADGVQFADPAWREELGRCIGQGALGAPRLTAKLEQLAVTWLDLGGASARRDTRVFRSAPVFGVVLSRASGRADWIRAGQAFERICLTAALRGLGLQPVSQIVEVPETRERLRELLPNGGANPLQPFRLGYAEPEREHTPRRPIEEVIL